MMVAVNKLLTRRKVYNLVLPSSERMPGLVQMENGDSYFYQNAPVASSITEGRVPEAAIEAMAQWIEDIYK